MSWFGPVEKAKQPQLNWLDVMIGCKGHGQGSDGSVRVACRQEKQGAEMVGPLGQHEMKHPSFRLVVRFNAADLLCS